jgi:hypothetical protein
MRSIKHLLKAAAVDRQQPRRTAATVETGETGETVAPDKRADPVKQ